jgi:hypothetical protein
MGGKVGGRVADVQLVPYFARTGGKVWIPIQARVTSHVLAGASGSSGFTFVTEPVVEEEIVVRAESVHVNRGIDRRAFDLEFDPGTPVRDKIQGSSYLVSDGGDAPKNLTGLTGGQAAALVDENITQAQSQAQGLKASPRSRSFWVRGQVWAYVAAGLAVATLAVAFILWRRSA